jgi:hypothetical protein
MNTKTKVEMLADQYRRLPKEDAKRFHELIVSCGEDVYQLLQRLNDQEKIRYFDALLSEMGHALIPHFMSVAIRILREQPDLDDPQLFEVMTSWDNQFATMGFEELTKLTKKARDRKVLPETIRRNAEIIRLHAEDPETWSNRELATRFEVQESYVRRVLKERSKWTDLALTLGEMQPS